MNGSLAIAVLGLGSFGLAAWLTSQFARPSSFFYMLDHPNERSLHVLPTPRSGGIAILVAIFLSGAAVLMTTETDARRVLWIAACSLLIAGVSLWDDLRRAPVASRLFVHVGAASALAYWGFELHAGGLPGLGWISSPVIMSLLAIGYVVWMTNLYNFMDGMDGFAGGMGLFGFGALAILGWFAAEPAFMALNLVIAAGCAGFLVFNFPPARIFMGDVGSSSLGFIAASLSLWGVVDGLFPIWAPLLVFSPFMVDATATLIRRLFAGERVWQAHKTHYYQRLVRLGWGHKRTVVGEYVLMLACSASALWGIEQASETQWRMLGAWCLTYLVLIMIVVRLEARRRGDESAA